MTLKSQQTQDLASGSQTAFDPRVKCVLVAAHQKNGRTVLQPLIGEQEAETIAELFRNRILEVWLSNGESDITQFDVNILKYRQVPQPQTRCQKLKNKRCLKNHFENLVSCEQCPLNVGFGENTHDKC